MLTTLTRALALTIGCLWYAELQHAAAEALQSGSLWPGVPVVQLDRVQTRSNDVVDDTFRYAGRPFDVFHYCQSYHRRQRAPL